MFRKFKPKTPREKELSEKIDKLKKKSIPSSTPTYIRDLMPFVPEYNFIILTLLKSILTENLKNPLQSNEIAAATIDLIYYMIDQSTQLMAELTSGSRSINEPVESKSEPQKAPDFIPYTHFLSQTNFLSYMFGQIEVYNEKVMYILEKFYQYEPLRFVEWILSQKQIQKCTVMNIFKVAATTQNIHAGRFVHLLTVSNPEVKALFTPIIKPILRKFPVAIVIDLMVTSNEIKEVIPSVEIESWLLTHDRFSLSDIELVTGFYQIIWEAETSIKLLLRSDPPEKMAAINWMCRRPPQDFDMTQEVVNSACRSMTPAIQFEKCPDCKSSRDPYMFVRIFIVSLANPDKVMAEIRNMIVTLLKDENEHVAAAAIQTIIYWVLKFDYKIKPSMVFRVASIAVDKTKPEALRYMFMLALHAFGRQFDVATTILQNDENLRFRPQYKKSVIKNTWLFPHIKKCIDTIQKTKLVDYNQAADVVSYISAYLCDAEELKGENQQGGVEIAEDEAQAEA